MAIYKDDKIEKVLNRIKEKIKIKNISMGSPLSEEELLEFEKECNITLPSAFRRFIKEVGNGCEQMIDGFPLIKLDEVEWSDLSKSFTIIPKDGFCWEHMMTDNNYLNVMELFVSSGNIELIDIGCGSSYNLMVIGECSGEVWNFTDVGIQPLNERQDFLGWFELWLDMQDDVDYFKDYICTN